MLTLAKQGIRQCLRKNLLTNEIDYGTVDLAFEEENLKGNIIADHPYISLQENDTESLSYNASQKLEESKRAKITDIKSYYDNLRNFKITSGSNSLQCKADQEWHDTIINAIGELESQHLIGRLQDLNNAIYNYYIVGSNQSIPISYKTLQEIRFIITANRKNCAVNQEQHIASIQNLKVLITKKGKETTEIDYEASLNAVQNYNYKVDFASQQDLKPIADVVIN